jgi:hypothetical protein
MIGRLRILGTGRRIGGCGRSEFGILHNLVGVDPNTVALEYGLEILLRGSSFTQRIFAAAFQDILELAR